jgi:co-chaperonin GroES (HSP10)
VEAIVDESAIQLTPAEAPAVEVERAKAHLRPMASIVGVEMRPAPEELGGILLPEEVADQFRADVGTVVASGDSEVEPGDTVMVRYGDGKQIDGFACGGYQPKEQVRLYGIAGGNDDANDAERVPWWDSVVAVQREAWQPTGDNVFVRRDPAPKQEGSIWLPDEEQTRPDTGTVVAVGPRLQWTFVDGSGVRRFLRPGDRVVFHRTGILHTEMDSGLDVAIMRDLCVYVVME